MTNLPWSIGFLNEIADRLRGGNYQPDLVRYEVWNICDSTGKHVAWARSREHAHMIVDAVNKQVPHE